MIKLGQSQKPGKLTKYVITDLCYLRTCSKKSHSHSVMEEEEIKLEVCVAFSLCYIMSPKNKLMTGEKKAWSDAHRKKPKWVWRKEK